MAVEHVQALRPHFEALRRLDPDLIVVSYDRASDTLMIHPFGRGRPAVSVPAPTDGERDMVFWRVDPETEAVIGFQIEDFLRFYVPTVPRALDWLHPRHGAELRGLSTAEAARLREGYGRRDQAPAPVEALLRDLIPVATCSETDPEGGSTGS